MPPRYAVIIPACNEEPCLESVLRELRQALDPRRFIICVGVNGSTDRTAQIAEKMEALVAVTSRRGYGHGCQAAIDRASQSEKEIQAYIFFAADGANDPQDIPFLVAEHERGAGLVLGKRTTHQENWPVMGWHHVIANRLLALWCSCLTGRWFVDIGPLRLIESRLFEKLRLREWTYGWTIEAQVRAAMSGAKIVEVTVRERHRRAGVQKVSRVSWRHSLRIGMAIFAAGWRTRFRGQQTLAESESPAESPKLIKAAPAHRGP